MAVKSRGRGEDRSARSRGVVTLRDVAQLAEVSISTASRALTGARRVNPELVERVREAASTLSYRPHFWAQSLRLARTMTLGIVYWNLDNPRQIDILNGFGTAVDERGYSLLVTNADGDESRYKTLMRRLFERRIDGLVLVTPGDVNELMQPYRGAGIPVVALYNRDESLTDLPVVRAGERSAVAEMAERLVALGHRSVAYLGTLTSFQGRRPQLIQSELERASSGSMEFSARLVPGDSIDEETARLVRELAAPPQNVTALLAGQRNIPAVLLALDDLGIRMPEEMSVVSFSESRWAQGFSPSIAAVATDARGLGHALASVLVDWIDGTQPPEVTAAQAAEFFARNSIRPAAQRPGERSVEARPESP